MLAPIAVGMRCVGHLTELEPIIALNRRVLAHLPRMDRSTRATRRAATCWTVRQVVIESMDGSFCDQLSAVSRAPRLIADYKERCGEGARVLPAGHGHFSA